jgi:outer membrane biosynthesis protein TonB
MSRIGKLSVSFLLALPLSVGACGPQKGTASPEDYYPLIQVALGGGETAAMIGRNEAIKAKSFGGCVAAEALITAFDSAGAVLAGKLGDKIVIPAVDLDVSECLALREAEAEPEAGDENASLEGPVVIALVAPEPEEKPAEEPAAEEPAAEEPAAEEPAAEEPAAEEPAAEEPAAEEKPAEEPAAEDEAEEAADAVAAGLKGNADAAALVEGIAGFTLVAVLHYAAKLKAANCKKGTAAMGAINYINGMIKPISEEIAEPDGKMSIPSVTIDLSECEEG